MVRRPEIIITLRQVMDLWSQLDSRGSTFRGPIYSYILDMKIQLDTYHVQILAKDALLM